MQGTMTSDIYTHVLNLIEMKLICEQCKKHQNFTQYPGAQILFKQTVSADLGQFNQKSAESVHQHILT